MKAAMADAAAREFFYLKDGRKRDADLHEPILAEGDTATAYDVSRTVAKRLGLTDAQIDKLMRPRTAQQEEKAAQVRASLEGAQIAERAYDESEHPRDDHGRWSDSGGGGTSADDKDDDKGTHPGEGYSASARLRNGVIYTTSVYDAQRALFEDRKVELDQPKKISTLIQRLGETAAEMAKQGKAAPNFNLCNVTVSGTNLFCSDTKGIPRVKMPQMDEVQTKLFRKYLKEQGYKVEKGNERSVNLRASQNELVGTKVAAKVAKMKAKGQDRKKKSV